MGGVSPHIFEHDKTNQRKPKKYYLWVFQKHLPMFSNNAEPVPSCPFTPRIPVPALLIEGKVDETAQGAADVALTYADPVPRCNPVDLTVKVETDLPGTCPGWLMMTLRPLTK